MARIPSPCTKVCIIEPNSGLCLGCGRTLQEIGKWTSYSEMERSKIWSELETRLQNRELGSEFDSQET